MVTAREPVIIRDVGHLLLQGIVQFAGTLECLIVPTLGVVDRSTRIQRENSKIIPTAPIPSKSDGRVSWNPCFAG